MEPFDIFAGTVMLVGPLVMWAKVFVVSQANRGESIPALRELLLASICRAVAITLLALAVWDNILDLMLIEGTLTRVLSVAMVLLIIAPAVRFLWAYFNHGFRSNTMTDDLHD